MDPDSITVDSEAPCPVILIPKCCTSLESEFEANENVYLDLNISTADTDGNPTCIYSGVCNVKLIDSYNVQTQDIPVNMDYLIENHQPSIIPDNQDPSTSYNQSQVWIDPERSPNIYNNYYSEAQEHYSIHTHTQTSHITVEKQQSCTYITQKLFNFEECIKYSPIEEYEHKKFKKIPLSEPQATQNYNYLDLNTQNLYEDDEIQCGVFLSQLPEEIMNETENRLREERKFVESQSQNGALKQLMSPNVQTSTRQTKTILFLGHDASHGQTIQKINVNDPSMECVGSGDLDELLFVAEDEDLNQKKYQCENCKQIFDQLSLFKQHMTVNHFSQSPKESRTKERTARLAARGFFACTYCDKNLQTREKFEEHIRKHGDPDVECDRCGRVFASKITLRNHRQLHFRKHRCNFCPRSFTKMPELQSHAAKAHSIVYCNKCDSYFDRRDDLKNHMLTHISLEKCGEDSSLTGFADSLMEDDMSDADLIIPVPNDDLIPLSEDNDDLEEKCNKSNLLSREQEDDTVTNEVENANSVISTVIANEIFLLHSKKSRKFKKTEKICDVCMKQFDRIGDLKRHLIEHVVRSTLAKSPVNDNGSLDIQCEVCRVATFTKVDKYKAHLREHAKLTIYKCTFCDKCFSDSSNFSKHKKVHGESYLQCDLCHRKFNSKKMIERHMEHHVNNEPIECYYCEKVFYFKSMLYKHLKSTHKRTISTRFRCKFCHEYYKSLKEKWNHEWLAHNVRKMIADCLRCGAKFRKYSELKKHCMNEHRVDIPSAKNLLWGK